MFRKVLMLMSVVLVFSACEVQAAVIYSTWVGGEVGFWGDAANWDPAIVPDNGGGNTFVVVIDSTTIGPNEVQVRLQQDHTVNQVDCYGDVDLQIWTYSHIDLTLEDANGLTNHGELDLNGDDQFDIFGNVTNTTGARLDDLQDVDIDGSLYNHAGGRIRIEGEVSIDKGCILNSGTIFLGPGDQIWAEYQFENSGVIEMYDGTCSSSQAFDNSSTGVVRGFGILYGEQLVRNKGQIISFGGSLVIGSEGSLTNTGLLRNSSLASLQIKPSVFTAPAVDVNNNGTIEVNAGGGVAFDCNLANEPNGIIELLGGTLAATTITQTADANFAGFGSITGDVIIDPTGLIELTGPTNIVGDVEIGSNATLEVSDGTTLITGHTTCNNGTIHMIGGRIICQGGLTNNNCNIIWEPGTYTNLADFNLDGTVNFKDFADFANTWLWQASWY